VSDLIIAARGVQLPLLAVLLLCACAGKTRRVISGHSLAAATGPTGMFPVRLRSPIAIGLFAVEFALAAGLILTAGQAGAGPPALVVRSATALLFGTAVAALYILRDRHPDAGCGCFGDLSHTPVSWRALTRSGLLCLAAVATLGMRPLQLPMSGKQAVLVLVVLAVELAALAALSPEISEIMVRLGYSEPCEVRRLPVSRTLSALRGSSHWRRYRRYLVSEEPVDVWREGCWRFVVFPAMLASRRVEVVFAVYLKPRRAPVRAGIFDATADRQAKEAAEGAAAAALAISVPLPRTVPVAGYTAPGTEAPGAGSSGAVRSGQSASGHGVPVLLPAQPHGTSRRLPHSAVRRVSHDRHRHSAGL